MLEYCTNLKNELSAVNYSDGRVRVHIDDRDLRGGEKKWQHVKRGVPIVVDIGPKDVAKEGVCAVRRDQGKKEFPARAEFVSTIAATLDEIQHELFARAKTLREENTRRVDTLGELTAYFTPANADKPEIHGGFAECHFNDGAEADVYLKRTNSRFAASRSTTNRSPASVS